jgi:hypothetical protein
LPLIRAIIRDVTELAAQLEDSHRRLLSLPRADRIQARDPHRQELESEIDKGRERMQGFQDELEELGVELKDYRMGLVDFPCWMDDHEVCLCWRLGEPEVAYWHEVDAGFAGRQKLLANADLI